MKTSDYNIPKIMPQDTALVSWVWIDKSDATPDAAPSHPVGITPPGNPAFDLLRPLRHQLDTITVRNAKLARFLCKLIPNQCPFERDITIWGRTILHIPPLCKLNPLYEELVGLRFRALCYLADECGEDITPYC